MQSKPVGCSPSLLCGQDRLALRPLNTLIPSLTQIARWDIALGRMGGIATEPQPELNTLHLDDMATGPQSPEADARAGDGSRRSGRHARGTDTAKELYALLWDRYESSWPAHLIG